MVFYAVASGRQIGVFTTWDQCKEQTHGYSGAKFKKFNTRDDALKFISSHSTGPALPAPAQGVNNDNSGGGGVSGAGAMPKRRGKGALSNCESTKAYLNTKEKAIMPKKENCQYKRLLSTPLGIEQLCAENNSTSVMHIKSEPIDFGADFIPLEAFNSIGDIPIKKEKQEPPDADTSAFFEDKVGDDELMLLALSALQEYPDEKPTPKMLKSVKKEPQKQEAPPNQPPKYKDIVIGNYIFMADAEGYVNAFLAGHSENVGSWNCSAGYGVYFGPCHPLNISEACTGKVSHFAADLEAAIKAIEKAIDAKVGKIGLHTNCEFLLKAVTTWMRNWRRNGWRNQNGKIVSNRKDFVKLDKLLNDERIFVKWCHTKDDHDDAAIRAMFRATELARNGCEDYLDLHPSKERDDDFGRFDDFSDYF